MLEPTFLFCLAVFGLTNALSFLHVGALFRRVICGHWDNDFYEKLYNGELRPEVKFLGRLVHCHACLGFWVAFVVSIFGFGPIFFDGLISNWIANGLLASAFNFILWVVLKRLGATRL